MDCRGKSHIPGMVCKLDIEKSYDLVTCETLTLSDGKDGVWLGKETLGFILAFLLHVSLFWRANPLQTSSIV